MARDFDWRVLSKLDVFTCADGLHSDWGAGDLASALASFATDVSRLQNLLPEISAKDRSAPCPHEAI